MVYFVTSNLYRIGMQAYITRSLYHGEESLGAQAQRAAVEAKKLRDEDGGPSLLPRLGKRADSDAGSAKITSTSTSSPSTNGNGKRSTPPTPPRPSANRSKKKKKRR